MNLINISYLCTTFSSSVSDWEKKGGVGYLLDGSTSSHRYSVHTLEEEGSFVQVDLPYISYVDSVEVVLRDIYLDKVVPLNLSVLHQESWIFVDQFSKTKKISIGATISAIRISRERRGCIVLSSVNIYTDRLSFNSLINNISENNQKGLVCVYAPFYGLGGRLSVIATALGLIGSQNSIKEAVVDELTSKVIDYPKKINQSKFGNHYKILKSGFAEHLVNHIFGHNTYQSEKNISHYDTSDYLPKQAQKAILVTRDNMRYYQNKGEQSEEVSRRLYSRIIPSYSVMERLSKLEDKFELSNKYQKALAVHVRHGNGERYYSSVRNLWGVKPPSGQKIYSAIKRCIDDNGDIEYILLSSDCVRVAEFIQSSFPEKSIIFLSEFVQDVGLGCNHNNYLFDKTLLHYRRDVAVDLDDEIAFSEILALSKCIALCGGESYFFEAVKAFGVCDLNKIYFLDNKDRYVRVDKEFQEISKVDVILNIFNELDVKTDGVFIAIYGKKYHLSYFDDMLFVGTKEEIINNINIIKNKLIELRLY